MSTRVTRTTDLIRGVFVQGSTSTVVRKVPNTLQAFVLAYASVCGLMSSIAP